MIICAVADCDKPVQTRGWCSMHYQRWLAHGDPHRRTLRDWSDEAELARFYTKVAIGEPTVCWPWQGSRDENGYGVWYSRGGKYRAHRWLLGMLRGKPLIGQQHGFEDACHSCDNPPCCNPAHLYVGTRKVNIAQALERGHFWQQKMTHCPQGHAYAGSNLIVRSSGARRCRACSRAADHRRRSENRHAVDAS